MLMLKANMFPTFICPGGVLKDPTIQDPSFLTQYCFGIIVSIDHLESGTAVTE